MVKKIPLPSNRWVFLLEKLSCGHMLVGGLERLKLKLHFEMLYMGFSQIIKYTTSIILINLLLYIVCNGCILVLGLVDRNHNPVDICKLNTHDENKNMNLSFQFFVDVLLHIVKNTTYSKDTKIEKIKIHQTATNDYLLIGIKCDEDYVVDMLLGLSKNEETKNEKYYSVCGCSGDVTRLKNSLYGYSQIIIELFNKCLTSVMAFVVGCEFLKEEVVKCLK